MDLLILKRVLQCCAEVWCHDPRCSAWASFRCLSTSKVMTSGVEKLELLLTTRLSFGRWHVKQQGGGNSEETLAAVEIVEIMDRTVASRIDWLNCPRFDLAAVGFWNLRGVVDDFQSVLVS
mmetsp:Transcript_49170/g.111341  ORF Transcript_49170/g.111341 Transcript_49170/m.111341 type:complete len:121 (-) Transcript_49170:212-574(-)